MNVKLPPVSSCEVGYAGCGTHELSITVDVTNEPLAHRSYGKELRKIAQELDPQDFDAELVQARRGIAQVAQLRTAISDVLRYAPTGGLMLSTALQNLEEVVKEVDVL